MLIPWLLTPCLLDRKMWLITFRSSMLPFHVFLSDPVLWASNNTYWRKHKRNSERWSPFSFYWRKHKWNSEQWSPFSFFWRKHKGKCKSCNPYFFSPFPKKTQKGIRNDEFLLAFFRTKTKQEIGFACTLQVASFPRSPCTQTGPGNDATLQCCNYPPMLQLALTIPVTSERQFSALIPAKFCGYTVFPIH